LVHASYTRQYYCICQLSRKYSTHHPKISPLGSPLEPRAHQSVRHAAPVRGQPIHRAGAPIDGVVRVIAKRTAIGTLTPGDSAAISLIPNPTPVLRPFFHSLLRSAR
jgi:hypothetical protein